MGVKCKHNNSGPISGRDVILAWCLSGNWIGRKWNRFKESSSSSASGLLEPKFAPV